MSFFSKIFGGGKLDLTDSVQEETLKSEQSNVAVNENKEPSPFLVDEETEEVQKN